MSSTSSQCCGPTRKFSGATKGATRFAGGFAHPGLLSELRLVVARLLCERLRQIQIPAQGWSAVEEILKPGNIVITSNWDIFVEWYAHCRKIRLRLGGWGDDKVLTLIKLHGSVDWTEGRFRKAGYSDDDFAVLRELQNPRHRIHIRPREMLRVRAVENMNRSWQLIKSRTTRPHMIMMSQGKTIDMEPIQSMWDDAYVALCAAKQLKIIGYSLPVDDVEIRTLLRAGVSRKGSSQPKVTVQNPEPSVHVRVRTYVSRDAESDYGSFTTHQQT